MPTQTQVVSPGPTDRSVRTQTGAILQPPADWVLLPPGDATLPARSPCVSSFLGAIRPLLRVELLVTTQANRVKPVESFCMRREFELLGHCE